MKPISIKWTNLSPFVLARTHTHTRSVSLCFFEMSRTEPSSITPLRSPSLVIIPQQQAGLSQGVQSTIIHGLPQPQQQQQSLFSHVFIQKQFELRCVYCNSRCSGDINQQADHLANCTQLSDRLQQVCRQMGVHIKYLE